MTVISPASGQFVVSTFYKFFNLHDTQALGQELDEFCRAQELVGTILLAHEGLNATVAGSQAAVDSLLTWLRLQPSFNGLHSREAPATALPFRRMKIKYRNEIVSLGVDGIDPHRVTGIRVEATRWNALISDPNVTVLDTRNEYESRIGSFVGALTPETKNFRDFPRFIEQQSSLSPEQPIAMFCTGGIRCEKASAFLLERGFKTVYQLDGGILRYLETVEKDDSLWRGDCFVFDARVAVDHDLTRANYEQCHGCRRPLSPADRQSPKYEPGVACPACAGDLSSARRRSLGERRHQVELAAARNGVHIGAVMAKHDDD